jgi:heme/copper-type cytochrome/quinol oxidase subunit 2
MRVAVLWTLSAIGVAVFVAMFVSVWRHRALATTSVPGAAAEYAWQMIPCLIVALCAAPAVHRALVDLAR